MTLQAIDYQSATAAKDFVQSLHDTGFGVLKNHPIQQSTVSSIYKNWQAFFDSERKHEYSFGEKMDGYYSPEISETAKGFKVKDIKEYFHYFHPWGICPEDLHAELVAYRDGTNQLAVELLNWVEQYTPADIAKNYKEPLSSMIDGSEQTLLRILHYPPLTGDEPHQAIRAAAHEDINLLTILPASNEPGLQVKDKEGDWMDVPCEFGNLIINIGDMLQEASGSYFPSTTHRVINPEGSENRSRIALPLFLHPRPEVVLSERYTANAYLQERLRELGLKD